MHLLMLILAIGLAIVVRSLWTPIITDWNTRWQRTLGAFLFSPLLLLVSAIAIFWMGPRGQMVRWWEGWGSYAIAIVFCGVAIVLGVKLSIEAQRSLQEVRQMPQQEIQGTVTRLLENPTPFIAQIGFWNPELVLSLGLLETLDAEHLEVVLTHEQAHHYYRDTFWFFWFGWLRRLTSWLPKTEALWQELLILRELRADRWAAQRVDNLLLAEALLSVVSAPQLQVDPLSAASFSSLSAASFSSVAIQDRLSERIDALLDETEPLPQARWSHWIWLLFVLLPLIVVPFHF